MNTTTPITIPATGPQMAILNTVGVEVFIVGGYVRDRLLKRECKDHDFVVTGGSTQMMLNAGFQPVGADFPVFLAPNGDEWALARSEQKVGTGYKGFQTTFTPFTTLEEDLERRDLTINAMARKVLSFNGFGHAKLDDKIIDPFNGQSDIELGYIRATSEAFAEDPLRVLRAARFAARFDFTITPATHGMMSSLVLDGEMETLTPERVWVETEKAMTEPHPERFWEEIRDCGAMNVLFNALNIVGAQHFRLLQNVTPELRIPLVTVKCSHTALPKMLKALKAPTHVQKACVDTNHVFGWLTSLSPVRTRDAELMFQLFTSIGAIRNSKIFHEVVVPLLIVLGHRKASFQLEDCLLAARDVSFANLTPDEQATLVGVQIGDRVAELRIEAIGRTLGK